MTTTTTSSVSHSSANNLCTVTTTTVSSNATNTNVDSSLLGKRIRMVPQNKDDGDKPKYLAYINQS